MTNDITFGIAIPAAGKGLRFGSALPKQFTVVNGMSILAHTVRKCLTLSGCVSVTIACQDIESTEEALAEADISDRRIHIIKGGSTRQDSVAKAILHESFDATQVLLVHDGVRPAASANLFRSVVEAAFQFGAAIPVLPVSDTIKVISNGTVQHTLDRSSLARVQTPQGARTELLRRSFFYAAQSGFQGTDDASVLEFNAVPVVCVDGEETNLKVTTPTDLAIVSSYLSL